MRRLMLTFAVAFSAMWPLAAQAPVRFEVASIKPSAPGLPAPGTPVGAKVTQRQALFSYLSLKDYIGAGYGVRVYQIIGPDWLSSTRFEVSATIPEGHDAKDLPSMVAGLLEERFHMKSHHETREFPVYALETLPSFSLTPATVDAPGGVLSVTSTTTATGAAVDLGDGASLEISSNHIAFKKVTFTQLAAVVERFVDRPVVDQSKREGRFTIEFDMAPEDFQAAMVRSAMNAGVVLPPAATRVLDTASGSAVPDALRTLGISLQARRLPIDVLVVDSIDRTPTEN